MAPRLDEAGELAILKRLVRALDRPDVVVGPGDDAAVIRPEPGMDLVATTDAFVEGRHWLPEWIAPDELGARLAVANLSDLAAMAAAPRWAMVSIVARPERDQASLAAIQGGIEATLAAAGAVVVGGNLAATSGAESLTLALLGQVAAGRAWTRRGARAGDLVAVTGHPGRAGAGLKLALALGERAREARWRPLLDAWLRPRARVAWAQELAVAGAVRAAIDLSDGLLGDLGHLCAASGVGARLAADAGGGDEALDAAARELGVPAFDLWAGASDDYELLLAVDPARREAFERAAEAVGAMVTFVGAFTDAPGRIERLEPGGTPRALAASGYDHFAAGERPTGRGT